MPTTPAKSAAHKRALPGVRWLLYLAGLAGIVRTAETSLGEAGASSDEIDPTVRTEPADLNAKAVFLTGVGLLLALWASVLAIYPLFTYYEYERTGGKSPWKVLRYLPPLPPQPRLQANAKTDLNHFRAAEDAALNSYRWVDRGRGVVSIPIGRAIQILAQRGMPPSQPGGTQYYNPQAGSRQTGFEGKVEPEPR